VIEHAAPGDPAADDCNPGPFGQRLSDHRDTKP
jgi:hypothetical protein